MTQHSKTKYEIYRVIDGKEIIVDFYRTELQIKQYLSQILRGNTNPNTIRIYKDKELFREITPSVCKHTKFVNNEEVKRKYIAENKKREAELTKILRGEY